MHECASLGDLVLGSPKNAALGLDSLGSDGAKKPAHTRRPGQRNLDTIAPQPQTSQTNQQLVCPMVKLALLATNAKQASSARRGGCRAANPSSRTSRWTPLQTLRLPPGSHGNSLEGLKGDRRTNNFLFWRSCLRSYQNSFQST